MLTARSRPWLSTVARVALAGVLLVAGGLKITDPQSAVRAVQAYELLPPGLDTVVGIGLPIVEVVLGLLLLVGAFTRLAAAATAVLMVVFIAGVASAWARGLSIDCGCFGGGGAIAPERTTYVQEILRDLLFVGLACWLVLFPASRWALDRGGQRPVEDVDDLDAYDAAAPTSSSTDPSTSTERRT